MNGNAVDAVIAMEERILLAVALNGVPAMRLRSYRAAPQSPGATVSRRCSPPPSSRWLNAALLA
jgi:hypothetical protein